MQKRMRQFDNPSGDPMFAAFAQMRYILFYNIPSLIIYSLYTLRICNLLEQWIRDYPHDFSVKGAEGALRALVTKSITTKTYLLHYGSEFLPFLETLHEYTDLDSAWALKVDIPDETEDVYSLEEEDVLLHSALYSTRKTTLVKMPNPISALPLSRERKSSLPHPLLFASRTTLLPTQDPSEIPPKQQLRDLMKLAQEVMVLEPEEVAQEITRIEARLFLDIQVQFPSNTFSPKYSFLLSHDTGWPTLSAKKRQATSLYLHSMLFPTI